MPVQRALSRAGPVSGLGSLGHLCTTPDQRACAGLAPPCLVFRGQPSPSCGSYSRSLALVCYVHMWPGITPSVAQSVDHMACVIRVAPSSIPEPYALRSRFWLPRLRALLPIAPQIDPLYYQRPDDSPLSLFFSLHVAFHFLRYRLWRPGLNPPLFRFLPLATTSRFNLRKRPLPPTIQLPSSPMQLLFSFASCTSTPRLHADVNRPFPPPHSPPTRQPLFPPVSHLATELRGLTVTITPTPALTAQPAYDLLLSLVTLGRSPASHQFLPASVRHGRLLDSRFLYLRLCVVPASRGPAAVLAAPAELAPVAPVLVWGDYADCLPPYGVPTSHPAMDTSGSTPWPRALFVPALSMVRPLTSLSGDNMSHGHGWTTTSATPGDRSGYNSGYNSASGYVSRGVGSRSGTSSRGLTNWYSLSNRKIYTRGMAERCAWPMRTRPEATARASLDPICANTSGHRLLPPSLAVVNVLAPARFLLPGMPRPSHLLQLN
ncbi:hypothetical protein FRC12_022074 [Ceratobasidium sp. 428]|nr:hypothetical protein FRC12_022074 [Ceratobasidium sp. 428]